VMNEAKAMKLAASLMASFSSITLVYAETGEHEWNIVVREHGGVRRRQIEHLQELCAENKLDFVIEDNDIVIWESAET